MYHLRLFYIVWWYTWCITTYFKSLFWLSPISIWHLQFKRIRVFHIRIVILSAKGENKLHKREITEMQVTQDNGDMELGNIYGSFC